MFGPIKVETSDKEWGKRWGILFTCLLTRAVHIDIVKDQSTESFMHTFRRHIARYGIPKIVWCDNASNFQITAKLIQQQAPTAEIEWNFITPLAPFQGGIYERMIGVTKESLRRVIGNRKISEMELETLLAETEAVVNSRPITYVDSESLDVLRPIDFLKPKIELILEENENATCPQLKKLTTQERLARAWKSLTKNLQSFWDFWQKAYVTALRERTQRRHIQSRSIVEREPKEGEVVLIKDEEMPRGKWKLGKIVELVKGRDSQIRTAKVKTGDGTLLRRTLNMLCPLEIGSDETQQEKQQLKAHKAQEDSRRPKERNQQKIDTKESVRLKTKQRKETHEEEGIPWKDRPSNSRAMVYMLTTVIMLAITPPVQATNTASIETWTNSTTLHSNQYKPIIQLFKATDDSYKVHHTLRLPKMPPVTKEMIAAVVLYIAISSVCFWYLALKLLWRLSYCLTRNGSKCLAQATRSKDSKIKKYEKESEKPSQKRKKRSYKLLSQIDDTKLLLGILTIMTAAQLTSSCSDVTTLNADSLTCTSQRDGTTNCITKKAMRITLLPQGQTACVLLKNNESKTQTEFALEVKHLTQLCNRRTEYFTRSFNMKIEVKRRCPGMGTCTLNGCPKIKNSDKLPEFSDELNEALGITGCGESCGFLLCGCFTPGTGCLFYKYYVEERTKTVYEVFSCDSWRIEVQLRVSKMSNPHSGQTVTLTTGSREQIQLEKATVRLALISLIAPPAPLANKKVLSDGTKMAVVDMMSQRQYIYGGRGMLQCSTRETAERLKCFLSPTVCRCNTGETSARIRCPSQNMENAIDEVGATLPMRFGRNVIFKKGNSIAVSYSDMASLEIQMEITGLRIYKFLRNSTCQLRPESLEGFCADPEGAILRYRCQSDFGTATATVICGEEKFIGMCDPDPKERRVKLMFNEAEIEQNCSVTCPGGKTFFMLYAKLQKRVLKVEEKRESQQITQPFFEAFSMTKVLSLIEKLEFKHIWRAIKLFAICFLILLLLRTFSLVVGVLGMRSK